MKTIEDLQKFLEGFTPNVYYQPPESIQMRYPAIVYSRNKIDNTHANNLVYNQKRFYTVTVIDKDPDGQLSKDISMLPLVQFDRTFKSVGLYHDVYTLNY